jgi:hypothetical protein
VRYRGVAAVGAPAIAVLIAATVATSAPLRIPAKYTGPIVRISIRTADKVRADVYWGKKLLGTTPLILERPRDSGPMDLVLRAKGYLTLRTRAYTFTTDYLAVRMTPAAERQSVLGYRAPLPDAGVPDAGVPDAGAAVPVPAAPPSPTAPPPPP